MSTEPLKTRLQMKSIVPGNPLSPYPLDSKEYFRFGRDFNSSYLGKSHPYDEYQTCYSQEYHQLIEDNYQKMLPRGWESPSGGDIVKINTQKEYKVGYDRGVLIEQWETFIDYDDTEIASYKPDIPSGVNCQRHFTQRNTLILQKSEF